MTDNNNWEDFYVKHISEFKRYIDKVKQDRKLYHINPNDIIQDVYLEIKNKIDNKSFVPISNADGGNFKIHIIWLIKYKLIYNRENYIVSGNARYNKFVSGTELVKKKVYLDDLLQNNLIPSQNPHDYMIDYKIIMKKINSYRNKKHLEYFKLYNEGYKFIDISKIYNVSPESIRQAINNVVEYYKKPKKIKKINRKSSSVITEFNNIINTTTTITITTTIKQSKTITKLKIIKEALNISTSPTKLAKITGYTRNTINHYLKTYINVK